LTVDAKDEAAVAFYRHHGFITLPDSPLTLFLPLATVRTERLTLSWMADASSNYLGISCARQ
jgi:hypothetical protein